MSLTMVLKQKLKTLRVLIDKLKDTASNFLSSQQYDKIFIFTINTMRIVVYD